MAGANELTAADRLLKLARSRLPQTGRFLVALSGGADSAAIAWALKEIVGSDRVRALHVHHGQPASDRLAIAAANVAKKLNIDFDRVDVEVPLGASFEGQARMVRLRAIEEAKFVGEYVVTAHHEGDAAETVFTNLLRGAGATGLAGIAPQRGQWIRPVLDLPSEIVRGAAIELGLPFIDDPANQDLRYTRNVIRMEVIPWLEKRLGVPVSQVVRRSAASLASDDTLLDCLASEVKLSEDLGAVLIPAPVLSTLPNAIAARVVRRALRLAHPPYPGSQKDVGSVLDVAAGRFGCMRLSGGYTAAREGPLVAVYLDLPAVPEPLGLQIGMEVVFGSWRLSMEAPAVSQKVLLGRSTVQALRGVFAPEAVVRASQKGERIDLVTGSKPVREAMSEAGIPVRLRSVWPVVAVGAKIAWVAGARLAGWACVTRGEGEDLVELSIERIRE